MNHPWQQPIRPLEYAILNNEPMPDGVTYTPFWHRVMFIRPTDDGLQIIGEHGAIWDARAITLRDRKR